MAPLNTSIKYYMEVLCNVISHEKQYTDRLAKQHKFLHSAFHAYIKNSKESTQKGTRTNKWFCMVTDYKLIIQKSLIYLCISNEQMGIELLKVAFTGAPKRPWNTYIHEI